MTRAVLIALVATACLSDTDFPENVSRCAATGDGCLCSSTLTTGTLSACDPPQGGLCCELISSTARTCVCSDASNAARQLHACTNTDTGCICAIASDATTLLSDWTSDACTKPAGGHCCVVDEQCICSSGACLNAGAEVASCTGVPLPACAEGAKSVPNCSPSNVDSSSTTAPPAIYCAQVADACQCENSTHFSSDNFSVSCETPSYKICCADATYQTSGFCTCSDATVCTGGTHSVSHC